MRRFDVIDRGMSLLFCGLLIVPTVKATQSNEFDAQAMQVRELLLLEQQQLRREISPTLNADELPIRGEAMGNVEEEPQLIAIYGVGKRLMAEFRRNGLTTVYLHGKEFPIGHVGRADMYRLTGINEQCVSLKKHQYEVTQCLHSALSQGEP